MAGFRHDRRRYACTDAIVWKTLVYTARLPVTRL